MSHTRPPVIVKLYTESENDVIPAGYTTIVAHVVGGGGGGGFGRMRIVSGGNRPDRPALFGGGGGGSGYTRTIRFTIPANATDTQIRIGKGGRGGIFDESNVLNAESGNSTSVTFFQGGRAIQTVSAAGGEGGKGVLFNDTTDGRGGNGSVRGGNAVRNRGAENSGGRGGGTGGGSGATGRNHAQDGNPYYPGSGGGGGLGRSLSSGGSGANGSVTLTMSP